MGAHLTKEQRRLAYRLREEGHSLRSIAKHIGMATASGVQIVLAGPSAARVR